MLLLVAPKEHKVRIEVGYGLEGTLTDALSSVIISSAIVPRFKAGDYSGGIQRGVEGIIAVLRARREWHQKADVRADEASGDFNKLFPVLFLVMLIFYHLVFDPSSGRSGRRPRRYGPSTRVRLFFRPGGSWGSGWGGGGSARRRVRRRLFRWRRLVWRRRGVGELVMEFSKEDHEAVAAAIQRGGEANERADRLRARASIVGLMLIFPSCGRLRWPHRALATDRFHAVERATDLLDSTRGFYRSGIVFSLTAAAVCCLFREACAGRGRIMPRSSNSSFAASPQPKIVAAS